VAAKPISTVIQISTKNILVHEKHETHERNT
jgi:hypothetical protein